ncbi:UNVERIFIED_CONTAM: hypothetical protein Sradi_0047200 [Sesamum radiatum]|uniref:Uncharacterized protein n=1 Tax=Sesamum radiatum TaxID=300843 RepID=A0AAW2WHU2_SESRA
METPTNVANKQKVGETSNGATQALQVVSSAPFVPLFGSTANVTPRSIDPGKDIPRIVVSSDAPPVELSLDLLRTIQQMIVLAIPEQLAVLVPARVATLPEMIALEQTDLTLVMPRPDVAGGPSTQLPTQVGDVPPQWLARLEYLQNGLQDVQYQVMGALTEERMGIPFQMK